MAKHVRFEMTDADGFKKIETDFSDEEWALLEEYATVFDELVTSPATRGVVTFGFSINWSDMIGWASVDTSKFPSKTELAAVLHFLRPIILSSERTYFMKVMNVIAKRAPSKAWKALRRQFEGSRFESMMTISVTPPPTPLQPEPKPIILNSGDLLRKWLNAFEYHRDADKAAEFSELYQDDFPTPEHVKGLMVSVRGTAWSVRNGKCVRPGGGVTPPPDARRGAAWRGGRCWLRAAAVLRDR